MYLFCKRALQKRLYSAKEPYNFCIYIASSVYVSRAVYTSVYIYVGLFSYIYVGLLSYMYACLLSYIYMGLFSYIYVGLFSYIYASFVDSIVPLQMLVAVQYSRRMRHVYTKRDPDVGLFSYIYASFVDSIVRLEMLVAARIAGSVYAYCHVCIYEKRPTSGRPTYIKRDLRT